MKKKPIVRLNMAWVKTRKELFEILRKLKHHTVMLDYPDGRKKPPRPTLKINSAYEALFKFLNIKYFAVSNVEDGYKLLDIYDKVPFSVTVIPKIESRKGVNNILDIAESCLTDVIMLDKEDIYTDIKADQKEFNYLVKLARNICKHNKIKLLELEGVIFREHK